MQPNVVIRQGAWLDRGIELLVESYLKVRRVVPPGVGAGPVLTVGRRFYWRVSERLVWEAGTFSLELVSWEMVDNR